jgi:putative hydrolase of the HAD superfamily
MPPPVINFIYFDLGNVVLNFDNELACRQMARVAGVGLDRVRSAVFDSGLQERSERGLVSSQEFYEEFCRLTDTRPSYGALSEAGSDIFTLNCPVIPIVAQLRAAGHRLGLLSNTCAAHWDYVQRVYKVIQYFETYVLSYEVGAMKPAAAIFERAASQARVRPEEIFFVDDRPEHVAGARACGWDAEVFTTPAKLAGDLRGRSLRFNY